MSLSTRTIVPKKKDQAGLVAVAFGPNEIMLRSAGAVNYGQEKLLARVIAGSNPAEPVHLVVRTDTLERFGVNVVLDDGKGNQTPMPTFEFDEKTPGGYTVTEYCPHCETEVEMVWSPKVSGFAAFCPFCGKRIMLCDACRHADEYDVGEPCVNCDQDEEGRCCRCNGDTDMQKHNEPDTSTKPEIDKFIALNTGHVMPDTLKALRNDAIDGVVCYRKDEVHGPGEYGVWVYIQGDWAEQNIPHDLEVCIEYAKKFDCDWIMFDYDVEPVTELLVWE